MKNFFQQIGTGLLYVLLTGLAAVACAQESADAGLRFDEAWIRAMPPGMKMTAGFGKLKNTGNAEIRLVAFSSPAYADVSLHRTEQAEGVSRMREIAELAIPAGATIELAPGGYHLMLMMPTDTAAPGTPVTLRVSTQGGHSYLFEIPVERR